MSDVPGSNQPAAAGQPPNASPAGEQPAGQQPTYLTREEALRLFQDEFRKTSQSITDRVSAKVNQVIQAAAAKGVTMTPEQAQAVIDASAAPVQQKQPETQAAPQKETPAQATQTEQQPAQVAADDQQKDPVTRKAIKIITEEFKIPDFDPENLDENEPEFAVLDLKTDDPEVFLASVRAYGKAKAERLQQEGTPARLPGLGSGGQASRPNPHEGKKGNQILEDYYRKTT